MYLEIKSRIKNIVKDLKNGRMIILVDDQNRENEGDIIFPGENTNTKNINFMLKYTSGIICLAMSDKQANKLNISSMVTPYLNSSKFNTNFTISIEAKRGVTTGVSAKDRSHTILVASSPYATCEQIRTPGHIFPLIGNRNGVLGRKGHTEGSIDLMKLAGFNQTAVLCELMNPDGSMMQYNDIELFSKHYNINIISINDIYLYRIATEVNIIHSITSKIRLKKYGMLNMSIFTDPIKKINTLVLSRNIKDNPIVRIHSSCITGDLFGSLYCDCQSQLHHALSILSKKGGILIYLDQEGRNIGLVSKLKAYRLQKTENINTVEANRALDLSVDNRQYDLAIQILKYYNITRCQILSNNPTKIKCLSMANIKVTTLSCNSEMQNWNVDYLLIKENYFKHKIEGIKKYGKFCNRSK
jgi:3,4-dihydroxy 2-butanone 4-phosphate synthase/GTP cyclohydrolase II